MITERETNGINSVYTADLDGDGDLDVLTGSDDAVAWQENVDGEGSIWRERAIDVALRNVESVYVADLDNDHDADILAMGWPSALSSFVWYENAAGDGTFLPPKPIDEKGIWDSSVYAADLDGDGGLDVLGALHAELQWYKNMDGLGAFGEGRDVMGEGLTGWDHQVSTADLDGDGDVDIVSGFSNSSGGEPTIAWYENTDGSGTFALKMVISAAEKGSGAPSVYAADLDGDGDVDVVSGSSSWLGGQWVDSNVAWYENTDGKGTFGTQQVITTAVDNVSSVHAADLDGDGDLDVLSASSLDNKIAWYDNIDGKGGFGEQQTITTGALGASSVHAADLDGDGDVDVLSGSRTDGKVAWFAGSEAVAGDANADCVFDQHDIVQVLQSAKYLTGESASWSEGDWNGNGVFDQRDLAAALETGNYLQGPYAAIAADGVFAAIRA